MFGLEPSDLISFAADVSFVDDVVVPLIAPANQIIRMLTRLAFIVHQECALRGLLVNFKVGKTQPIIAIRGVNSNDVSTQLYVEQKSIINVHLADQTQIELQVADVYKHVGTKFTAREEMGPELKARFNAVKQSCSPFLRRVLKDFELQNTISAVCPNFPNYL